ncbi:MLLT6 family protein [Megaselia abdita]
MSAGGKKKNELLFSENCHFLQIQSFLETFAKADDENQKNKSNGNNNSIKPQKFSISTKFLRKSRSKLKTVRLNGGSTFPASSSPHERSASVGDNFSSYNNDDPNAKFKDFSIDSLLNK